MPNYTYLKSEFTSLAGANVDSRVLRQTIEASGIVIVPLFDSSNALRWTDEVADPTYSIAFTVVLPAPQEAELDAIVAAHVGPDTGQVTSARTFVRAVDPAITDDETSAEAFTVGDGWINTVEKTSFILVDTTRGMRPDGSLQEGPPATWTFHYILDGWAIQDDWVQEQPDGSVSHGMNIRSFNPETRKWDNRWLSSGNLQWKYFESEKVGATMVMTGGGGKDGQGREFIDRNTFLEIAGDSWKWRKDRSFDGGETWIEGVFFIDARRLR